MPNDEERRIYGIIRDGDLSRLEDELVNGLDVNFTFKEQTTDNEIQDYTLLDVAVMTRQIKVAQFLIDRGCDVTYVRHWPGATQELRESYFLQNTCMYQCLVRGDVEMATVLVKAGFNVNLQDLRQCSCLWHAVDSGNCEMVDAILMSPTVNVNLPDLTFLQPLHVACLHGHSKIVHSLLKHGANANAIHVFGNTPLILACKAACYDSARLLILHGAKVNVKNIYGVTPISKFMHNSNAWHDLRILNLLINAGTRIRYNELLEWKEQECLDIFNHLPCLYDKLKIISTSPRSLKQICCRVVWFRIQKKGLTQNIDVSDIIDSLSIPVNLKRELAEFNLCLT